MPVEDMYVVLLREKGLFAVRPVPGQASGATIEAALGVKGGYSTGLIEVNLPAGATQAWVAWVEDRTAGGVPHFEFRCFDPSLTAEEVEATIRESGQETLRINRSEIL